MVKVYENDLDQTDLGDPIRTFFAFAPTSTSGVRVALGDIDGDGTLDTIAGSGPGSAPQVTITSGAGGQDLGSFFAFDLTFTGGVEVASGDVDGDGRDDIVVAQGSGGVGLVRAFSGRDRSMTKNFLAFGAGYDEAVSVAVADYDGDGYLDLVLGTGEGAAPVLEVVSGADSSLLASFAPLGVAMTAGFHVAAGDVNGDGTPDFVIGYRAAPLVKVLDGASTSEVLADFFAFDPSSAGEVRVAAADANGDGRAEIFAAAGAGSAPQVKVFDATDLSVLEDVLVFDAGATQGVTVAARVR